MHYTIYNSVPIETERFGANLVPKILFYSVDTVKVNLQKSIHHTFQNDFGLDYIFYFYFYLTIIIKKIQMKILCRFIFLSNKVLFSAVKPIIRKI